MALAAATPDAETVPVTRGTGAAGLLLVVVLTSAGSPGAAQGRGERGLRYGPHGIAVRRAAGTDPEVWYPGACGRRPGRRPRQLCTAGTPDSGRFPLLVYAVSAAGADTADAAAAAYFVSHGYVVAWVPARSSATAARNAVASWPFVDAGRSALWRWDQDAAGAGGRAGPWRITLTAARSGGTFTAAIAAPGRTGRVTLELPAASAGRLAVVIGRAFLDTVLCDWGGPPEELGRWLQTLGLRP